MIVRETTLPGVKLLEPRVFADSRGFFLETFNADAFAAAGLPTVFSQDNHSRSTVGVLRGLHYQREWLQGKVIRVIRGAIYDVAVDIRLDSPTFGQWVAETLSDENHRMLWIPPGFAHGFYTLTSVADVAYKCTNVFHAGADGGILWSDPELGIPWPCSTPLLSEKDSRYLPLRAARDDLPRYDND